MELFVVGLAGAHGTGKTTILKAIKATGHKVDESQLSREAQVSLGWPDLKPAQESQENMWDLQDAILDSLQARDRRINETKVVTLVDRTPADVWGYTKLWISKIGEENIDMKRAERYRRRCLELSYYYRSMILVPIRKEIPFVPDPRRADEESRPFHANVVEEFVENSGVKHNVLHSVNLDHRVIEVKMRLNPCKC